MDDAKLPLRTAVEALRADSGKIEERKRKLAVWSAEFAKLAEEGRALERLL